MDVIEIIKDAFVFPSQNIQVLLIYVVLSIVAGVLSVGGAVTYALGIVSPECFMWGGLAGVIAMLIGWILSGYLISVIKSGIDQDSEVPEFSWWDNFITGFNNCIVSIVYFIIPAFIVVIAGYLTNIYGNVMVVAQAIVLQATQVYMGTSTAFMSDAIAQALANLAVSLAITATVAVIVFVIFSFFQTMAQARLANTGSLTEALNVIEAAKDIKRIGIGKVILLVILIIVVAVVVQMILSAIANVVPLLSILSLIVTPYLVFFAERAVGLLYSDIA